MRVLLLSSFLLESCYHSTLTVAQRERVSSACKSCPCLAKYSIRSELVYNTTPCIPGPNYSLQDRSACSTSSTPPSCLLQCFSHCACSNGSRGHPNVCLITVCFDFVLTFGFSMQLIIRDIPVKSRIETQVKLQIELADCISPSNPHGANLVQRWPWIRVPNTPSVKHRTREPPGMLIAYFSVPPHMSAIGGNPARHAPMHEDPPRPSGYSSLPRCSSPLGARRSAPSHRITDTLCSPAAGGCARP